MTLYVRFAPSPTGRIHIGNARTALINWIVAYKGGGRFVLRFDDTDEARSRTEYADSIVEDLAWLGIVPDLTLRQSDRVALYQASADCLKADGRLYACYETAEELERRRKRQQARGQPPVYDRAALDLTPEDHDRLRSEGRRPHWRFKLDRLPVTWIDGVRGSSRIDCASLSDPVLVREDGSFLYTLPSVVDDLDLGITDVIRGEDHVTNTAVQIQLAKALGGAAPRFAHHNLLTTADGEGLSKRSGALSLGGLREAGIEALAVAALAVMTGSSDAVHPVASLDALASGFELSHISRNPARFDPAELVSLSARTLHALPFEAVEARLAGLGIEGASAASFWSAVRGNLERFDDCRNWWHIVRGTAENPIAPAAEDPVLLDQALALLPLEPWDESTWSHWTSALKTATGRKGRALFHPLRLALTGRESGPELAALLPLIGRERAATLLGNKRSA